MALQNLNYADFLLQYHNNILEQKAKISNVGNLVSLFLIKLIPRSWRAKVI